MCWVSGCSQDLHESSTGFPHRVVPGPFLTSSGTRMRMPSCTLLIVRSFTLAVACLLAPLQIATAASVATLFRLFLLDGSPIVSYGEYVRVDDRVIFSMPVGGPSDRPRLHVVTLPAGMIDWPRTEQYSDSARYQRYAEGQGEEDFQLLSNQVASVLNDIALSTDRARALRVAEEARRVLATWPQAHFGYRQNDVREIVSLVDEAISSLRAALGANAFEVSLVAMTTPPVLVPVLDLPGPSEQVTQIMRVLAMTSRASDRVALLQSALALLDEAGSAIDPREAQTLRRSAEAQIQQELAIDARYLSLSQRMVSRATQAAASARVSDVERVLNQIPREDAKLGRNRPELVQ